MAATLSGTYTSAPDTPSPVFPDRLIRPLPKRPIRSRLSHEAAESILYPPAPPATQVFYGSYSGNGDVVNDAKVYVQQTNYGHEQSPEGDHHHPYDDGVDSGDEDGPVVVRRSGGFHRSSLSPTGENRQKYAKHLEDTPTKTSSSGPDGYDAFENTNNKKKRKIPTSGNPGNHSNLSADMMTLGISSNGGSTASLDDGSGTGSYYGTGNPASPAGNGISGPGRGRYGRNVSRTVSGRTPLATHNPNAWLGGRSGTGRKEVTTPLGQESIVQGEYPNHSDQGIISAAIANAAALSSSAPQGQDNTSLLDQTRKPSPTKTQFTFTCESDSSKGMAWQTQNSYSIQQQHRASSQPLSAMAPGQRGFSTQGTQTSPNMASQTNHQGQAQTQHASQSAGQNAIPGKKSRRSPSSIYALAARQRRLQQQYANLHHPPNIDEIWICEFCEYESIFGRPPEALIRQYEIKDRKERRRLAEKRRLLEKAKMKGRKGKKATKNAAKAAAAHAQQSVAAHQQGYDRQHHPGGDHDPTGQGGGYDDNYIGDEYEDEVSAQHAHAAPSVPPPSAAKQAVPASNQPKAAAGSTTSGKGVAGGGTVHTG
ncbi:hypothetical protein BDBG_01188 [Blastomyces gilchristii SLH14081]|uniref:Uncharacterized protein n=1 Tax=Blastomyces gilchristii (strain SLH14081) TaxID=559298 RepID=A0A179U9M5_BLAGS|nr:uncharacterized protein BDBG_01188 [Blastomyces gilchristii SLH14081]EQL31777.1 hypothetical protein BDFG_05999 [Blastomyces dermatitidis ATCC 26199]OAT04674.1 hypothetical protein BDBG_01188 [Blastomyces gilchristii SLH14081]